MYTPRGVEPINDTLDQIAGIDRKLARTTDPDKRSRLEEQKRNLEKKLDRLSGRAA